MIFTALLHSRPHRRDRKIPGSYTNSLLANMGVSPPSSRKMVRFSRIPAKWLPSSSNTGWKFSERKASMAKTWRSGLSRMKTIDLSRTPSAPLPTSSASDGATYGGLSNARTIRLRALILFLFSLGDVAFLYRLIFYTMRSSL